MSLERTTQDLPIVIFNVVRRIHSETNVKVVFESRVAASQERAFGNGFYSKSRNVIWKNAAYVSMSFSIDLSELFSAPRGFSMASLCGLSNPFAQPYNTHPETSQVSNRNLDSFFVIIILNPSLEY
jgi:hypothetical protein